ncbi:MAG: hypothetical protein HC875_33625 [Anaerolineales bacterium]|nr:hypothetical protein [Anaerolineales bacterium]
MMIDFQENSKTALREVIENASFARDKKEKYWNNCCREIKELTKHRNLVGSFGEKLIQLSFFLKEIDGIEVKASLWNVGSKQFWFNQLRTLKQNWKTLFLIGIDNEKVYIWEIKRDLLQEESLKNGHTGSDSLKEVKINQDTFNTYRKYLIISFRHS